jgi:lysophospholipase L1-like esterase
MLKKSFPYGNALMRIGGILLIALYLVLFALPRRSKKTDSASTVVLPAKVLDYENNIIVYKPVARLSERFLVLVERASTGKEQLRILHIGDSHVQADFFTGETRRLLSAWLSDEHTSRGFTFPFQVAGSNNPDDYIITSHGEWWVNKFNDTTKKMDLGVAGIALTTRDASGRLTVKLNPKDQRFKRFNILRIFYNSNGMPVVPVPMAESQLIEKGNGFVSYLLNQPMDSVTVEIVGDFNGHDMFSLFGFDLQNSQSKLIYHAVGVNGADTRTHLRSQNFTNSIIQLNPQVIVISLGTNDAFSNAFNLQAFASNLELLVSQIQQVLPQSLVILTTPGDHLLNREISNEALERVQTEIYRIAGDLNCGVWDFYQVMGGAGSIHAWAEMGFCANDMVHLNRKGYQIQGALFFSALVKLSDQEPQDLAKSIAYE